MSANSEWKLIEEINLLNENYTVMSCDTRDFRMICHKEDECSDKSDIRNYIMSHDEESINDSIIDISEIIPLMMEIKAVLRQHKKIKCMFHVPENMDHYAGWFKYIRFYRYKDNKYVMYLTSGENIYLLSMKIVRPDNIKLSLW